MSDAQIFQVFSLLYVAVGVGMLINPEYYKKICTDFAENASTMYFGGIAALAVGYLILAFRGCSVCVGCGWSVIIPIIGWLALIKGLLILVRPQWMIDMTKSMLKEDLMKTWAIVILFLGLAFSFFGFCPKSPI